MSPLGCSHETGTAVACRREEWLDPAELDGLLMMELFPLGTMHWNFFLFIEDCLSLLPF